MADTHGQGAGDVGSANLSDGVDNDTKIPVDKELDLRGEVCPYTFVKSKLALEPMASGEVLRVLVDYEPAISSVPRSMQSEGHHVLHIGTFSDEGEAKGEDGATAAGPVWQIVVKRA